MAIKIEKHEGQSKLLVALVALGAFSLVTGIGYSSRILLADIEVVHPEKPISLSQDEIERIALIATVAFLRERGATKSEIERSFSQVAGRQWSAAEIEAAFEDERFYVVTGATMPDASGSTTGSTGSEPARPDPIPSPNNPLDPELITGSMNSVVSELKRIGSSAEVIIEVDRAMILGRSYKARLHLQQDKVDDSVLAATAEPVAAAMSVVVSPNVHARADGDRLDVTYVYDPNKTVTGLSPTSWEWNVVPVEEGIGRITFYITCSIYAHGAVYSPAVRQIPYQVDIRNTWPNRLFNVAHWTVTTVEGSITFIASFGGAAAVFGGMWNWSRRRADRRMGLPVVRQEPNIGTPVAPPTENATGSINPPAH